MKALEIDDTLPEAHTSLAWVKTQYDWDWAGAERKFKQAIALNPDYTPAHYWYALFLSAMGRHDEAIAQAGHAHEIEPLSLLPNTVLGWTLYFARQYSEAAQQWRRTVEMEPNFSWVRWLLGSAYEQMGMHSESLAELNAALKGREAARYPWQCSAMVTPSQESAARRRSFSRTCKRRANKSTSRLSLWRLSTPDSVRRNRRSRG